MRNTTAISVTIPVKLAKKLEKLQRKKGRNYSSIVTDALDKYVLSEEISMLRHEMTEAALKAGIFSEEDAVKAVREVRGRGRNKNNT